VKSYASQCRWLVIYDQGKFISWEDQKTYFVKLRKPKKITYYRAHYFCDNEIVETFWKNSKQSIKDKHRGDLFGWEEKEFEIPAVEVKE